MIHWRDGAVVGLYETPFAAYIQTEVKLLVSVGRHTFAAPAFQGLSPIAELLVGNTIRLLKMHHPVKPFSVCHNLILVKALSEAIS
jgi:hypothetical protein